MLLRKRQRPELIYFSISCTNAKKNPHWISRSSENRVESTGIFCLESFEILETDCMTFGGLWRVCFPPVTTH